MMTEESLRSKRKRQLTALGLNSRATDEMRIREMMRLEVDRLRRLQWAGNEKENRYIIWYRETRPIFVVIIIAFIFGFIALPDI